MDEEQRNMMKRSGVPDNGFEEIIDSEIPDDVTIDCTLAWQAYIIKVIVNRIQQTERGVFKRNKDWDKLIILVKEVYGGEEKEEKSTIQRIIPKLKRGNIELDVDKIAKAKIEFEWENLQSGIVRFSSVAKRIIELYQMLYPVDNSIYIFVDELELSFKKNKSYKRDVALIRDLIVAVERLSDWNRNNGYNVFLIAAIRSEVYNSVIAIGNEINKSIADFGITITWGQNGGNIEEHPLLKMLEKRIHYSEQKFGLSETSNIWTAYFPKEVFNKKIQNYILDQTWGKPRDIIRLFGLIKQQYGSKEMFTQDVFEGIRKSYAKESWIELSETLSASYNTTSIEGVKKTFIGIKLPFTLNEYKEILKLKMEYFDEVKELMRTHQNVVGILDDLYRNGIIGNYERKQVRFFFKGDDDFDPTMAITLHYPLLRFFDAKKHSRRRI